MTPFEQRLADTPHRKIPAGLRARILAARPRRPFPALVLLLLRNVFSFPHPIAWGAVAACWVAIAILNLSGPRGPGLYAVTPKGYRTSPPSPQEFIVRLRLRAEVLACLDSESADSGLLIYYRRAERP